MLIQVLFYIRRSSLTELSRIRLSWRLKSRGASDDGSDVPAAKSITLPVYLNSERSEILVNVDFPLRDDQDQRAFVETGVAFLANP